jgi:hypothetical protein
MVTILIIVLVIILLGGLGGPAVNPNWRLGYGTGYGGMGVVGLILIILLILILVGRVPYSYPW